MQIKRVGEGGGGRKTSDGKHEYLNRLDIY